MLTIRQEISPTGKGGVFYHKGSEEIEVLILSLREESEARDGTIHRVSGGKKVEFDSLKVDDLSELKDICGDEKRPEWISNGERHSLLVLLREAPHGRESV
jgi:hypothetical protein